MKKLLSIVLATVGAALSMQAQGVAFLNINPDASAAALAGTGIARPRREHTSSASLTLGTFSSRRRLWINRPRISLLLEEKVVERRETG